MTQRKLLNQKRVRRAARVRARIFGAKAKPRLAVFRSGRHIYAQLINDEAFRTISHASSLELGGKKTPKIEAAARVGELLAKRALEKGIKSVVLDRRAYKYHGRVKALTEGARKGGLKI